MPNRDNFPEVFERLKAILLPLAPRFIVQNDTADNYYLNVPPTPRYPQGVFFGAVQIKKNYVSFHLMPIYIFPDLVNGLSEPLRKRMQGKSCFNFTRLDEETITELTSLVQTSIERVRGEQFLSRTEK